MSCVYLLQKIVYWKSCVVLNFVQLQQRKCNTCAEFLFSLIKTLLCCCCGDNLKLSIYTMINGSSLKIVRSSFVWIASRGGEVHLGCCCLQCLLSWVGWENNFVSHLHKLMSLKCLVNNGKNGKS